MNGGNDGNNRGERYPLESGVLWHGKERKEKGNLDVLSFESVG